MTQWNLPPDDRKAGLKYPNFSHTKTPSGHEITTDDTLGSESVTIQHRSGSLIQMQHDGSIIIRSEKHQYSVVFGDKKMIVTGSHDITINGGGSLKVQGDYDMHVDGDMNHTISGNHNVVVGGNHNVVVAGNQDIGVNGSNTMKSQGNYELTVPGKLYLGGDQGVQIESTSKNISMVAATDITTAAQGKSTFSAAGKLQIISGDQMDLSSPIKLNVISGNLLTLTGQTITYSVPLVSGDAVPTLTPTGAPSA